MTARTIATTSLTVTEYAVLGLLGQLGERETSGYDLKKLADETVGYLWAPSKTQLYAVLGRLAESGLVRRRDVAQQARPDKQLYAITPAGRDAVREWLNRREVESEPDRNLFVLKLFFGAQGDLEALVEQLQAYRDSFAERLAFYERRLGCGSGRDLSRHFPVMTLRYGIARARAAVEWADETLETLRS